MSCAPTRWPSGSSRPSGCAKTTRAGWPGRLPTRLRDRRRDARQTRPASTRTRLRGRSCATCCWPASKARDDQGRPLFAFKLHQFIGKGDTVYVTLEPPDNPLPHHAIPAQRPGGQPRASRCSRWRSAASAARTTSSSTATAVARASAPAILNGGRGDQAEATGLLLRRRRAVARSRTTPRCSTWSPTTGSSTDGASRQPRSRRAAPRLPEPLPGRRVRHRSPTTACRSRSSSGWTSARRVRPATRARSSRSSPGSPVWAPKAGPARSRCCRSRSCGRCGPNQTSTTRPASSWPSPTTARTRACRPATSTTSCWSAWCAPRCTARPWTSRSDDPDEPLTDETLGPRVVTALGGDLDDFAKDEATAHEPVPAQEDRPRAARRRRLPALGRPRARLAHHDAQPRADRPAATDLRRARRARRRRRQVGRMRAAAGRRRTRRPARTLMHVAARRAAPQPVHRVGVPHRGEVRQHQAGQPGMAEGAVGADRREPASTPAPPTPGRGRRPRPGVGGDLYLSGLGALRAVAAPPRPIPRSTTSQLKPADADAVIEALLEAMADAGILAQERGAQPPDRLPDSGRA